MTARVIWGSIVALVLFAAVSVAAYAQMFNQFALYDDSGTLLLAFDGLIHGRGLYDEVVLPYGPFFYQVFQPVFEVISPTTNHGRMIVLVLGLFMVVLAGGIVWTISRSILLTLASLLLSSMVIFSSLASEPMHPVVLIMVLSLGLAATTLPGRKRWPTLMGVVAGVLIGGLIMSKVNIGGYALLSVAFAAVAMGRFRGADAVRVVAAGFLILLPFLVAGRTLAAGTGGAQALNLLFLVSISMVPIVYSGFRLGASLGEDEYRWGKAWLTGVPAGVAGTIAASTAVFLATEGSLPDLVNGVLVVPTRMISDLTAPLDLSLEAILLSVIAATACFVFTWTVVGKKPAPESHRTRAILRIAVGCLIWVSLALAVTGSLETIVLPAATAWVVLIPRPGSGQVLLGGLPRLVIASFAVIGLLGAFPIAGSQLLSAALIFIPVGAFCIGDGISELKLSLRQPAGKQPATAGGVLLIKAAVLLLVLPIFASSAAADIDEYRSNVPTTLQGSSRLRLPRNVADQFEAAEAAVTSAECTSLVIFPAGGSLVLWSGLSRTSPMALSNWLLFFDDEQQDALVTRASQTSRPCLIRAKVFTAPGSPLCAAGAHPVRVQNYLCGDTSHKTRINDWELLIVYPH